MVKTVVQERVDSIYQSEVSDTYTSGQANTPLGWRKLTNACPG